MNRASKVLLLSFHKSVVRYHIVVATKKFRYIKNLVMMTLFLIQYIYFTKLKEAYYFCSPGVLSFELFFAVNFRVHQQGPWATSCPGCQPFHECFSHPSSSAPLPDFLYNTHIHKQSLFSGLYFNLGTPHWSVFLACMLYCGEKKSQSSHFIPGLEALRGDISFTFPLLYIYLVVKFNVGGCLFWEFFK